VTEMQWPAVMNQPTTAPYRPEVAPEHRRMAAIADGLMCWGNVHASKAVKAGPLPKQFGDVVVKLSREAGIYPKASSDDFLAAAKGLKL
jgi:hypothetical protein